MTKLILGTVQFGLIYGVNNSYGKPNSKDIKEIIDLAYENNIKELDTADAYGDAQLALRDYFNTSANKFKIMSKFVWDKEFDFHYHLSKTLEELSLNELEGYYFHRFDDYKNFEYFDQIRQSKKNGKLKYLGVSLYSMDELEYAINRSDINLIQLPFNLFDRSKKKQDLLAEAKRKGIKIYIRSAFLQGLFFKDINRLPLKLLPLKKSLESLFKLSKDYKLSIEEMALGYINSKDFIDGVLIGVDSVSQLKSNLRCSQTKLPVELVDKIENIEIEDASLLNPSNWG